MKFKIGLVGHGSIARLFFVPGVRVSTRAEIAGVCGRDPERCRRFAGEQGIPSCYGSYEEMLEDPDIEGVLIATPNYLHCEQVLKAAAAGKHVLCEKPVALDMEQALLMVEACERAGVVFMVAHHLRYKACNIRAAEIVGKGELGRLSSLQARWSFNISDLRPDDSWRNRRELSGGGQLMNVNSHCIDLLVYVAGRPVKVSAFMQGCAGGAVEFGSIVIVEFENGAVGTARGSYGEEGVVNNLEISGNVSSIVVEGACSADRHGGLRRMLAGEFERVEFDESPYTVETDHFVKSVKEKFEPVSSGRRTLDTMKVVTAAYLSAETGKHVNL